MGRRRAHDILGDPGADNGGKGKSKRAGKYGTKKSKERREEPLGTMSYQTSSKRSPPFWLLIGARKLFSFCKRMQQLPTILGPTTHRERDTIYLTLERDHVQCACVAPTILEELCKRIQHCCATLRRPRNKRNIGSCWLKSLTGFKLYATTPNNSQQLCKRTHHVISNNLGIAGQYCCVSLHGALTSK